MADLLTAEQKMAVENRGGKLLVSAAAGSGKTKVLVDRLMSYIQDPINPANIDDFLIITYTKAAASELRSKIAAKLSELISLNGYNRHLQQQLHRLYLAKISTVHGFCTDVLRQNAYQLDIAADFRVADESECTELQMRVMTQLLEDVYTSLESDSEIAAFIDSQGFGRDDRQIPDIIYKVYNSARCHLNPNAWLNWCLSTMEGEQFTDVSETVWGKYLIDDLHDYLEMQIQALSACAEAASVCDFMEKPTALLSETIIQLNRLLDCKTWDEIVLNRSIDYGRMVFSKKCTDAQLIDQIKAIRESCKKGLEKKLRSFVNTSDLLLTDLQATGTAMTGLIKLVKRFDSEYASLKRSYRILDFSDLEHKMLDLLLGKSRSTVTTAALELGVRYREIMVDEYQDSNAVQDAIFSALTDRRGNCFMVGDVKQSIYQFRLADPGIFIEKYNSYAPAEIASPREGRKVLLSSNFRSSGGVISAVNDVFFACMSPKVGGIDYGDEEMLREGIPHIPLDEPETEFYGIDVREDTYAEEAAFVAERIAQLIDGTHFVRDGEKLRAIKPEDVVILLRSPGSVGGEFRYALECSGIPCSTGDNRNLFQTEEISTLRSLLQIISNPHQDIPLVAVLASRVFCFTADNLAVIRSSNRGGSIYDALCKDSSAKAQSFRAMLEQLRYDAKLCTISQLIDRIYIVTQMDSLYAAMEDGAEKSANLQLFCQLATEFESRGQSDLEAFLSHLDALEERGVAGNAGNQSTGAVTIMSIHKSKGLEFPVVFLCGLSRGFNQESVRAQVLCDKSLGLGLSCVDNQNRIRYPSVAKRAIAAKMMADGVSEEMRVLYVAMTRARDRLIMTYAAQNLQNDLRDIAMRMDFSCRELLTSEADCPGIWVLMTSLKRAEAGEMFALGGRPDTVSVSDVPWHIRVVEAPEVQETHDLQECTVAVDAQTAERIKDSLAFRYPYEDVTLTPSKLTATQLKGRAKDMESAENTQNPNVHNIFRRPGFAGKSHSGVERGKALHASMQYIRYENCDSITSVESELQRLLQAEYITVEQAAMVDCEKIVALFQTAIGKKIQTCKQVLREFKFSILDDASQHYPGVENEQILLQGVVDCALIEDDGITVIDFKTDHVTQDTLQIVAERYRMQVTAYVKALERIYQMKVNRAMLYFFSLNQFVEL